MLGVERGGEDQMGQTGLTWPQSHIPPNGESGRDVHETRNESLMGADLLLTS